VRRADRLFTIVQLLRGGRPVTARRLAERLEVSERTIYRDIVELTLCGVPVCGEPGRGYTLPRAFDIPPLMFERHEIEALVLGARMVEAYAGPGLVASARSALVKIRGALPAALAGHVDDAPVFAPAFGHRPAPAAFDLVHEAIGANRRLAIRYQRPDGTDSERTIRPLGLYFWGKTWTLGAWCELRSDFRSFRVDRITEATAGEPFPPDAATSLDAFLVAMRRTSETRSA
jgi:predicted DNA-binding transcriptional regulator YafY